MNITLGLRRAQQVNRNGVAIIDGDIRRNWAEVGERVAHLAGAFATLGLTRGDRLAVLALNSGAYLELYLATAWAGVVIVPLNTRWSVAENAAALEDCSASALCVDAAFAAMGRELAAQNNIGRLLWIGQVAAPEGMTSLDQLIASADPVPDAMCGADDLAGIFYTGGTTGRSKGVMLSHGNLVANAFNALAEGLFGSSTVYLHAAPMFHLANGAAMYSLLISGGTNVIIPGFTPEGVIDAVTRHGVNEMLLVPTMIQMLVDSPAMASATLPGLRRILYGASPMSEAVLDRVAAKLPHVGFVQAYGMTELSPIATISQEENHVGEARRIGRHRSAGRATFGVEVRIVDENGEDVPVGQVGEVIARGANVMMGYWNRPEETAKAVVDGWMHTGDGGRMDEDGFIYIVDRIKDMIITGGENVYSTEVENTVAQHPAVAQCAVIGIPDERWGETVHAEVILKAGMEATPDDIIAFCKERIAGYKCPRSVAIRTEPMPMSGAGKILKTELRKPFWDKRDRSVA